MKSLARKCLMRIREPSVGGRGIVRKKMRREEKGDTKSHVKVEKAKGLEGGKASK